jgi:predicted nucleic acid-binding protein
VSVAALERDIRAADRILLDSSALIAYLNGGEPTAPVVAHIIDDFLYQGRNTAVISMVTVMEVIVQPMRVSTSTGQHALNFLTHTRSMYPQPIDIRVAQRAAMLRASYNFKTPDALIIATGFVHSVDALVTNDRRWNMLQESQELKLKVCLLQSYLPFP